MELQARELAARRQRSRRNISVFLGSFEVFGRNIVDELTKFVDNCRVVGLRSVLGLLQRKIGYRAQQLERVRQGLDWLDPRCRRLMDMLFNDDDTRVAYGDMAEQLNMAVGSIGPTRARCLDKLRQFLD